MDSAIAIDRRVSQRMPIPSRTPVTATLRPGCVVILCNVSTEGVALRSARQLRPGGRVHLQVVWREQRLSLAATVVRCTVAAVHPLDGICYAGALRFDQPVEWR